MKYIALLRGINVGGNNKVSMSELKQAFELLGFTNVSTYINSGNVIFDTQEVDEVKLVGMCEDIIEKTFGFLVKVAIISQTELQDALRDSPAWWGDEETVKHNAIVVIAPAKTSDIMHAVGEAKPEYEKVAASGKVIFWSAPLKTFGRTRYSKIVGTRAYQHITIRNANTMRKLLALVS